MVKLSVLMPTYNNKDIVWLAMEGLCTQVDSPEWELLIYECGNDCGVEHFKQWSDRLLKANCKLVRYLNSKERQPLSLKWVKMIQEAKGELVALQGSDDYAHPERNRLAVETDADWYDCRYYYQYHVKMKKLIQYAGRERPHKTGFNMCIRRNLLLNLPLEEKHRLIDGWLFQHAKPQKVVQDQSIFNGVSTTGMNTISVHRDDYFNDVKPPFRTTTENLNTIGIPDYIAKRLMAI